MKTQKRPRSRYKTELCRSKQKSSSSFVVNERANLGKEGVGKLYWSPCLLAAIKLSSRARFLIVLTNESSPACLGGPPPRWWIMRLPPARAANRWIFFFFFVHRKTSTTHNSLPDFKGCRRQNKKNCGARWAQKFSKMRGPGTEGKNTCCFAVIVVDGGGKTGGGVGGNNMTVIRRRAEMVVTIRCCCCCCCCRHQGAQSTT